jgi:hypothetical protein
VGILDLFFIKYGDLVVFSEKEPTVLYENRRFFERGKGFETPITDGSLIQLFSIYNLPISNQILFK